MRYGFTILLVLMAAQVAEAASASRTVTVNCGHGGGAIPMMEGKRSIRHRPEIWPPPRPHCSHPFTFRMEVTPEGATDGERTGPDGNPLMLVRPGTTYTIRVYNPLPVRAGVTLSVDGLNTLNGKPGGAASGAKWIIAPHGTATISGWQTGSSSARRFVFTAKRESYASYRSESLGRDLTVNSGVIGAAFFWNAAELESALNHHWDPPAYEKDFAGGAARHMSKSRAPSAGAMSEGRAFDAGTGMGERVVNAVRSVSFDFTAGMYSPSEALAIYYDFAGPGDHRPRPFDDSAGFAPEMPRR